MSATRMVHALAATTTSVASAFHAKRARDIEIPRAARTMPQEDALRSGVGHPTEGRWGSPHHRKRARAVWLADAADGDRPDALAPPGDDVDALGEVRDRRLVREREA